MKVPTTKIERVFAVGDIHGCYDTLQSALCRLSITENDSLIVLGDLLDRGPQIKEVLDFLLNRANTKIVLGNHEYSFIRYLMGDKTRYAFMLPQGLEETLDQLSPNAIDYAEKLSKCDFSYQIEGVDQYIFCHANYPWDHGSWDEAFLWDRNGHKPRPTGTQFLKYNGPIIVHGHTPVLMGQSCYEKVGEKIVGINLDMGAYHNVPGAGLRFLNVNTGEIIEHPNSQN